VARDNPKGSTEWRPRMLEGSLGHARRMISDLIGGADVAPGDLRREQAAGVE